MRLTPDALALLPQVRRLVAAQEDIVSEARRLHHPAGTIIRVSLSAGSFNAKKVEAFGEYEAAHSPNGGKLHIEAVIDQGHEAVLRGEVDDASVPYPVQHEALSIFPLGACANLPLATPGYLPRFGTPHEPEELAGHTLLVAKRPHSALCGTLYRGGEEFSLIEMRRVGSAGRRAAPRARPGARRMASKALDEISCGADKGSGKDLDQGVRRLASGL